MSWQDDFLNRNRNLLVPVALIVLVTIFVQYIFRGLSSSRHRGLSLPPGPHRKWIIGNLLQMPKGDFVVQILKWAKDYGPIVYIQIPNKKLVFLNSAKVAFDLLDSRSSIYSDRPRPWMPYLAGRHLSIFFTPFPDPRFNVLRKLLQDGLNPRAVKSYRPIHIKENRVLLRALAQSPNDFRAHFRRNVNAVIIMVAYGYQVAGNDDPLVQMLDDIFRIGSTITVPGRYLVEFIPSLRFLPSWFPGAGFKRHAEYVGREAARVDNVPFDWSKEKISSGDYVESFTSRHLLEDDRLSADPQKQEYIKWASSALYMGGGDTTVSSLTTFFLVMALYPDVQKKAQADIDQIALDRLPTPDDYESLPYIKAIIKEIARWGPVSPLGLPHRIAEDDVYENYLIPKGATVFGNIWAIAHDEEVYPDPFTFDPSRHLGDKPQLDPFKFTFGFGRRVCPGAHLAEMTLFLNIATILTVFNISKPVDGEGNEVEPKIEWVNGITSHLKPFECTIQPRSIEHLSLLDPSHDS